MTGIVHPARIAERKSGVASPRSSRSRPPSAMAAEVTTLLQRYPHLREAEMDRLVEIYPQLAMLDVALMTNDEAVAPKLDHFVRENKGRLRTPVSHILWLAALPAAAIAAALWALAMPAMAG